MTRTGRVRAWTRHAYGNPVALGYLGLVAAAGLFAAGDALLAGHPDASLSAVWVLALTMPASLPFLAAGSPWLLAPGLALAALVQAAVLGAVYRRLTRRGRRPVNGS